MTELTLSKMQGGKDSFTGRVTFAQTREFKIGMAVYFTSYLGAIFADDLGYDWFIIPGFVIAFIAFGLAYFPIWSNKNAGKVILGENEIETKPKKEDDYFPNSPISLETIVELDINIIQSIRWWSSFVIMQFVIKQNDAEESFGVTIKNRSQEKQYLETLESWYRAGYPLKELNANGTRVFKLNQGKNYAEIQKIKQEYGIDW